MRAKFSSFVKYPFDTNIVGKMCKVIIKTNTHTKKEIQDHVDNE